MKKISTFIITVFWLAILAVGCGRTPPCKNTNPIFDKYSPGAKEYKDELINQLAKVDTSKLTYLVDDFQEANNLEYIRAYVKGDGLCAKIILLVKGSKKGIESMMKRKAMCYVGAELENLKFDIQQDSVTTEFVFQEASEISCFPHWGHSE